MQVKAVVALICALVAAAAAEPTSEPTAEATSEPTATPTTCEPISYEALDFPGSVCLWENKRDISADYTSPTRKEVYLVDTKAEKVSTACPRLSSTPLVPLRWMSILIGTFSRANPQLLAIAPYAMLRLGVYMVTRLL